MQKGLTILYLTYVEISEGEMMNNKLQLIKLEKSAVTIQWKEGNDGHGKKRAAGRIHLTSSILVYDNISLILKKILAKIHAGIVDLSYSTIN